MTDLLTESGAAVVPSATPRAEPAVGGGRARWMRTFVRLLVATDALAAGLGGLFALVVLGNDLGPAIRVTGVAVSYEVLTLALVLLWPAALALAGAYDERVLGNGSEEYRRTFDTGLRLLAVISVVSFAARLELARGFVAVVLPTVLLLSLWGRHRVRKWVHRQRGRGRFTSSVVVVGSLEHASSLVRHLQRTRYAGFRVVGVCVPASAVGLDVDGEHYPVLGTPDEAEHVVERLEADCVAISDVAGLPSGALRRLAWSLEGTGIDLIVVPALTDVAGPRIVTRPVAGLPLLHVEEPVLRGAGRVIKEVTDRAAAVLALVVLLPFLAAVGLLVRLTSHGPALYRQQRVGKNGQHFVIWKFRTMRNRADEDRAEVEHLNEFEGPLFKIRRDPRLTPIGRWLRRFSIDELPQLLHVVTGQMSLVGPRPPLPCEVEQYDASTSRRLLVKPGLTGLWQVSGRSDLAWDEAVRLDLYYVENWSPALDLLILWKTAAAVLAGRGAY